MDLGLKGKVALVAGASQGMGRATALSFAREGAKVSICARGESALNGAADMIRKETGAEVLSMAADMIKAEDIQRFVSKTAEHFGRLDIVVNNAGGPPPGEFMKFTDEDWDNKAWPSCPSGSNMTTFTSPPPSRNRDCMRSILSGRKKPSLPVPAQVVFEVVTVSTLFVEMPALQTAVAAFPSPSRGLPG